MPKRVLGWWGVMLLSGCAFPLVSPDSTLPVLRRCAGHALLPDDYVVATTQPAPRGFTTALRAMSGAILALGTVSGDDGGFTISVPVNLLTANPALYQVDLRDPSLHVIHSGLVFFSSQADASGLTLDGTSTTMALAAQASLSQGGHPERWNLDKLLGNAQIQAAGRQYDRVLGRWSNQATAEATPPAPSPDLINQVRAIAEAS